MWSVFRFYGVQLFVELGQTLHVMELVAWNLFFFFGNFNWLVYGSFMGPKFFLEIWISNVLMKVLKFNDIYLRNTE
jgi:hypothetical protein